MRSDKSVLRGHVRRNRGRYICMTMITASICTYYYLLFPHNVLFGTGRQELRVEQWNDKPPLMTIPRRENKESTEYDYMEERRRTILSLCDKKRGKHRYKNATLWTRPNFLKLGKNNIMYCKTPKVASHFWSRLFHIESINSTSNNPFHVKLDELDETYLKGYIDLEQSSNIVWVRDPYTRLFATYVDKLFAPNPYFWSAISAKAMQRVRPNHSPTSIQCGHDLKFDEYIKYVLWTEETGRDREMHSIPISEDCKVCDVPYLYIGKMETFNNDARYVLRAINLTKYVTFVDNITNDYENDAVYDTVQAPFGWRRAILKCMDFDQALKRMWRKLQIRGLLSRNTRFPLNRNQSGIISLNEFLDIVYTIRSGYSESDNIERKTNRYESFMQAYKLVGDDELSRLRKVYANDFEFFDYEQFPGALYSKTTNLSNVTFFSFSTV